MNIQRGFIIIMTLILSVGFFGTTRAVQAVTSSYYGYNSLLSQLISLFSPSRNSYNANNNGTNPIGSIKAAENRIKKLRMLKQNSSRSNFLNNQPSRLQPSSSNSFFNCKYAADKNTCERTKCYWDEDGEKKKCFGPDDLNCKYAADKNTCEGAVCSWVPESNCTVVDITQCWKAKKEADCESPACKWNNYSCISTCYSVLDSAQCALRADCKSVGSCKGK